MEWGDAVLLRSVVTPLCVCATIALSSALRTGYT